MPISFPVPSDSCKDHNRNHAQYNHSISPSVHSRDQYAILVGERHGSRFTRYSKETTSQHGRGSHDKGPSHALLYVRQSASIVDSLFQRSEQLTEGEAHLQAKKALM